ncbi:MAG: alanine--tRNA ligase-related protein, partial [Betaproteobacteria bacterium]
MIALNNIDEVIKVIKASKSPAEAVTKLCAKFKLSEIQAKAILEMRLQRLTGLERAKIDEEYKEVTALIAELSSILADPQKVLQVIIDELTEIKQRFGDERRTEIVASTEDIDIEDMIVEEDMMVTITHSGYIKRNAVSLYKSQHRGGRGKVGMGTKEEDFVEKIFVASTHHYLLIFTNTGKVHWLKVYQIPQGGRAAKGKAVVNLISIAPGERMAAILQGVDNIYEIDTTKIILDRASAVSGARYGVDHANDVRLRVVADHARTCAFLISDGVLPGNEGRGYVLRRIMRRVIRNMRLLGGPDDVMGELMDASIEAMGAQYPELVSEAGRIRSICAGEEEAFLSTLRTGTTIFESAVADIQRGGGVMLGAEQAFALHDTFGFPIDLTLEMAAEKGLEVDHDGFRRLMNEQRDRAKADARERKSGLVNTTVYREVMEQSGLTSFVGYDEVVTEATLRGLLIDGVGAQSAREGQQVQVVLDRTPFYAEGGGQLADAGVITLADGSLIEISDVQQPVPGLYVHRGRVMKGEVTVGAGVVGSVDMERRRAISRAHTATHMVHKAFRETLGETATQMGSENSPGRFRFDFPSAGAVPPAVLIDVEQYVNEVLARDLLVHAEVMSQEQARAAGAMALFGEKYGDKVRVVSVGDWARELCGGTHTQRSSQVGLVKFLSEGSIGAGVRRVEALVGVDAYQFLAREHLLVSPP